MASPTGKAREDMGVELSLSSNPLLRNVRTGPREWRWKVEIDLMLFQDNFLWNYFPAIQNPACLDSVTLFYIERYFPEPFSPSIKGWICIRHCVWILFYHKKVYCFNRLNIDFNNLIMINPMSQSYLYFFAFSFYSSPFPHLLRFLSGCQSIFCH